MRKKPARKKMRGRAIGSQKECVFLRIKESSLLIVRRWKIIVGNHWRLVFFLFFSKKKKDEEEKLETLGDALTFFTRVQLDYAKNKFQIIVTLFISKIINVSEHRMFSFALNQTFIILIKFIEKYNNIYNT